MRRRLAVIVFLWALVVVVVTICRDGCDCQCLCAFPSLVSRVVVCLVGPIMKDDARCVIEGCFTDDDDDDDRSNDTGILQ